MQTSSSTALTFYPRYCFPESPTFNTWARLTAANVHGLRQREGFGGQNIYFHINHPIKWVRLVGVVVAFDEYEYSGKKTTWVITLDDSSGANIEVICSKHLPADSVATKKDGLSRGSRVGTTVTGNSVDISGIDLGAVVKVKGGINEFRGEKQITLERINIITSTTDEATAWTELSDFHTSVLSKPWIIQPAEDIRLKEEAYGTKRRTEEKLCRKRDREITGERKKKRGEAQETEKAKEAKRRRISDKENQNIDRKVSDEASKDRRPQRGNNRLEHSKKPNTLAQITQGNNVDVNDDLKTKQRKKDTSDKRPLPPTNPKISSSFLRKVALWTPTPPSLAQHQSHNLQKDPKEV